MRFSAATLVLGSLARCSHCRDGRSFGQFSRPRMLQGRIDPFGRRRLDGDQRRAHHILDPAKPRQRIFGPGDAGLDEHRLVQRHQPVLQVERLARCRRASVASWNSAQSRGATLEVTEMRADAAMGIEARARKHPRPKAG